MKNLIVSLLFLLLFSGNAFLQDNEISIAEDSVIVLDEFDISLNELISMANWGRNPFLPYFSLSFNNILVADPRTNSLQPQLNKIFWDGNFRCALINHRKVYQGDVFYEMMVQYIGEDIVVMAQDDIPCMILKLEK